MGCNQSKRTPTEGTNFKQGMTQPKAKGKQRLRFYKMFTRRVNKVGPVPLVCNEMEQSGKSSSEVSSSQETAIVKTSLSEPSAPGGIQSCHVVASPSGELKVVQMEGEDSHSSPAEAISCNSASEPEEEIFAEGCNYELQGSSLAAGDTEPEPTDRVITETSATIEEEVELELEMPPTPELDVIGKHIQPVLTEEQAQEAFRIIGEELMNLQEELRQLNEDIDSREIQTKKNPENKTTRNVMKSSKKYHGDKGDGRRREDNDEEGLPGAVLIRKNGDHDLSVSIKTAWD